MNVINFQARQLRRESYERHKELSEQAVTIEIVVPADEIQAAFDELLTAAKAMGIAQDALNRAHAKYLRLKGGSHG